MVNNEIEEELKARTSGPRIFAFDALRGLAAVLVVCHHFRLCFFAGEPHWYLRPFFAGTASVVVFFVLSGYVLSIPYWGNKELSYTRYLARRFFRIYVPYAAAILLALLFARHFLNANLPLTPWFYLTWHTPITFPLVWRHFLTVPATGEVNTAIWSLRYEMEMSVLLPLVCRLFLWLRGWWPLGLTLGMSVGGRYLQSHASAHSLAQAELGWTLLWISFFLYGTLLSWKHKPIGLFYTNLPSWFRLCLALIALIVFASPHLMLLPAAACIFVLTAQHTRVSKLLTTPIPEYLGRISYSLYLMHATVLFSVVILYYGKMPLYALAAVFVLVSLLVSHLFCVVIEEPANVLGRSITRSRSAGRIGLPTPRMVTKDSAVQ